MATLRTLHFNEITYRVSGMANKIDWYRVFPSILHVLILFATLSWFLFQFDKRLALQDQKVEYLQQDFEQVQESITRNHQKDHAALQSAFSTFNDKFDSLQMQMNNLYRVNPRG